MQVAVGTSDQIQKLDLGIFRPHKMLKKALSLPKEPSVTTKEIIAIIDSWKRTTTHSNVTSAFKQAGIYKAISDDGNIVMSANIQHTRAVRGMKHFPAQILESKSKTSSLKLF